MKAYFNSADNDKLVLKQLTVRACAIWGLDLVQDGIDFYAPDFRPEARPRNELRAAARLLVNGGYAEFYLSADRRSHLMIRLTEKGRAAFGGCE
jgi:hypothetical protein